MALCCYCCYCSLSLLLFPLTVAISYHIASLPLSTRLYVKLTILLQDELTIPLTVSTIPSAKEFRDAIESLSPEQQRFAKVSLSLSLSFAFDCFLRLLNPYIFLGIPHAADGVDLIWHRCHPDQATDRGSPESPTAFADETNQAV